MDPGTLHALVASAASAHAHRVAVTFDSGSLTDRPLTLLYRDLFQLAGELSHILQGNCTSGHNLIGLCCSDDLFTPVWILGILQKPAAYVPVDPEAPGLLSARVMIQCGLQYCAVKTDLLQRFQAALVKYMTVEVCLLLPKFKLTLVRVEALPEAADKHGSKRTRVHTCDLAYVLHTSGTTGLPKIVKVPHKCILPNILHLRSLFQLSADDVVFLASPLTFDPSVVDMFLALSSGAQLLIIPAVIKKMPSRLAHLLFSNHKTTFMQVTPTLLGRFGPSALREKVLSSGSSLRVLVLGGESCPSPSLLSSWRHQDNRTLMYNIYGVTEVSCWACCYRIPQSLLQRTNASASSVPLGTPLTGTLVEVRDDHGRPVTDGEGQVFIGGEDRVCLLDDEDAAIPGTMRATGDWVDVRDSQMFYVGRTDRTVKRHGKRINLDSLQHLILSLPEVEACVVCLYEGLRLLAFVVTSTSRDHEVVLPSSGRRHQDETSTLLLNKLSLLLPSHSVPDTLVLVAALSQTPHGKVDMQALIKTYERQTRFNSTCARGDMTTLKLSLQTLWQEALGPSGDATVDEKSNFLFSGGDSLKALRLSEDILSATGAASPRLLELILDGTFSDVLHHVAAVTLPLENTLTSQCEARKRQADASSAEPAKRGRQELTEAERPDSCDQWTVKVVRRAGEVTEMSVNEQVQVDAGAEEKSRKRRNNGTLSLSLSWSSDTGRCVDASPVLLVQEGADASETAVFIGSHSHRLQALELHAGTLLWERVLGGRIEASAAVSRCGRLVIVGCYDGGVYVLCAASGETRWVFRTGDAVKSCAAVDPLTGLAIVGSHDGHVYALDPVQQRCVWKRHCAGGAVFSSPYLHTRRRRLYVATLGGALLCLRPESGEVAWTCQGDAPFFSSPNCSSGHVVIGSVNGNICCFGSSGELRWQFLTKGPVFSSPCVTPDHQRVLCGSHDGHLYCLNCADGSLVWSFQTTGKVFSSPCVFDGSALGGRGTLVALASTDGTVCILDGEDGHMLISHTLPGELFSSPVVYNSSVVVGCRNDYVYCLKLSVKEET